MSDADMKNYKPKTEMVRTRGGKILPYTASGAYQILERTWQHVSAILQVADFTPENQDQAALLIIEEKHATSDVEAGNLSMAIAKLKGQWVSLPGGLQSRTKISVAREKFKAFVTEEFKQLKAEQADAER